jgi:long-subunit acyl-CoA synthetase (AMP-forming)
LLSCQDLNALRDDIVELKPTLLVGVPRVYERIYEGSEIRTSLSTTKLKFR